MDSGRLKAGWTLVAFGDVIRRSTERSADPGAAGVDRYVGLEHLTPGELAIRRWGDVGSGTTFTNIFRARSRVVRKAPRLPPQGRRPGFQRRL